MDKAYFVSRTDIINWINNLLAINMSRIQQLGSGAIYCQILDVAFPEKVPLQKVKWNAYLQTDFIYNFKILQIVFEHLGIQKAIDIQKLTKAKYQDNLQFIQWLKAYLTPYIKQNKGYYDAKKRRNNKKILLNFKANAKIFCCNKENQMEFSMKQSYINQSLKKSTMLNSKRGSFAKVSQFFDNNDKENNKKKLLNTKKQSENTLTRHFSQILKKKNINPLQQRKQQASKKFKNCQILQSDEQVQYI